MQFKKSAVIRVLITLYFSTVSLCHYLPEKETGQSAKKNESSSQRDQIQICGNALTTMIVEACDGIVGSPSQGYLSRESIQTKITEDCCDRECPLDYLQNYCGQTPLFTIKKTVRGRLLNKLNLPNRISKTGYQDGGDGHRNEKKNSHIERQNTVSRTWPSIQIGTISPEIDEFGGQPIVVVKKTKSN